MRTWTGFLGYLDGIWIRRHDAGLDTCLLVDAHHLNPNRTVHGGVLLSLLDYTLGGTTEQVLAISNHNDPEASRQHPITISLTTQFTGGARHGLPLFGRAWVQRRTRSITFVAGELTSGDLTVATASAVFKNPSAARG
jgi:acyl-coenzyme A thioesterase PaaI-like protein